MKRKPWSKVPEDQLSVAIGKGGQNVRLASKLAGYDIDIESSTGQSAAKVEANGRSRTKSQG